MGEGCPSRRLAFVEDDATVRAALALGLEALPGIQVVAAEAGLEGLAALIEAAPELVIVDLNLQGVRGDEVLERLAAALPRATLWLMSASRLGAPDLSWPLKEKGQLLAQIEAWRQGA
ncbi:MAG: response regulator [Pseudomonadales bacterium]